jgi:hypothetical protein
MVSGFFLSPFFLLLCAGLIAGGTAVWLRAGGLEEKIPLKRIFLAYGMVGLMSILISLVDSYVPQDIALSKWKVAPENYWGVQIRTWIEGSLMLWVAGMTGIAFVGLGLLSGLYKLGLATTPILLLCTIPISVLFAYLQKSEFRAEHFWYDVKYFTSLHLLLAFAFALGLRLPWRTKAIS